MRSILTVALNTGMRRGEILNLRWDHVDFDNRLIKVEKTKSGCIRYIPINAELLKTFKNLRVNDNKSESVFVNPETGKPFKDVKRAFKGACRRAGISGFRLHDCRHTFGSRLVEKGVDLITVKELLGHSTVKVTERYTHSSKDSKKRAVETLVEYEPQKEKIPVGPVHVLSKSNDSFLGNGLFSVN